MINTYFPVLVLIVLAAGFVTTMLLLSIFLGPKKDSEVKDDPFECGTVGSGNASDRMNVKFYLVAMIFILFDIEIIFLFPYATQALNLGWPAFYAVCSFVMVLSVGLLYIWKRGVLDWN